MSEKIEVLFKKDNKKEISYIEIWESDEKMEHEDEVRVDFIYFDKKISKYADNFFDALLELRKELEELGIHLLCKGCSKTVYPSAMQLNMGEGRQAYDLTLGKQASNNMIVDIFAPCNENEYASAEEQHSYFLKWIESLH